MLNKTDVRRECSKAVTFEKGENLAQHGAVYELEWENAQEDGFEIVEISSKVSGSRGELYEVDIKVDEEYREILEYFCECPAYYSYSGLCKHCVATLLLYIEERKGGRARSLQPMRGRNISPVRSSSYGFEALLGRYSLRDKVSLLQKEMIGKVRLEPHFTLYGDVLRVEFRIGHSRMYVLKDVGTFAAAVAQKQRVTYGKELDFYHQEEAFSPQALPLVRFLVFSLLQGATYMEGYFPELYGRELCVSADRMDPFWESVAALTIYGKLSGEEEKEWVLQEGEPERKLDIAGEGAGILVEINRMPMLTGRNYLYFFDEGRIWRTSVEQLEQVKEFLEYMNGFGKNGLYVAPKELPAFTRDMLPVLSQSFQVSIRNFELSAFLPEKGRFELYLDAPQRNLLTGELYVIYGEEKFDLFAPIDLAGRRDVRKEIEVSGTVASFFNAFDPERKQLAIAGEEEVYAFIREGLGRLQEVCAEWSVQIYISDALKGVRILPAPHIRVGISLAGELLELSFTSEELSAGQLAEILSRYDRKRKYYRLKDGSFLDLSDEGLVALAGLGQSFALQEEDLEKGRMELPAYRALYLDARLQNGGSISLNKDRNFRSLVRNMKTVEDGDYEVPTELDKVLRGYQKTGFMWIKALKANGFGGILADDMGLGKTLQVIAFLLSEWKDGGAEKREISLVVTPASLVYNWKSELERFAPTLQVTLAAGSASERKAVIAGIQKTGGVLVTSYDLLRRDLDKYEGMEVANQILDEAQFIKNHSTQAARSVKAVRSRFRLALTGTPVENRLSELWSIFDFVMPGFLFSYSRFREEMEAPIMNKGDEEASESLQKMIRPFVMRRLKKDVLSDLPDKIEKNMYAAMEGEQKELYAAHVQRLLYSLSGQTEKEYASNRIQVLAELTKLRQICCDPGLLFEGYRGGSAKMQLCLELIRNACEGGHKVLLFSQFTSMLERLKEAMRKEKIQYYSLDGSTPKAKRLELAEAFNQDKTQVFCISLKAGGTGLNLTGADIVIHYDPWWNVAVQNQATDRAHRIGQQNVVTVYRLIAKGTIEEKIVALQEKKKELAEQILGQEEMGLAALTKEALMEILG